MDVDAYVVAHRAEWARLEQLARTRRRLDGREADELVALYQRAATHLSVVQSASPDPALVGRLSSLVATSRSAVTGAHNPAWRDLARFFRVVFPVAVWRARWWVGLAFGFSLAVALASGLWVSLDPTVAATITPPEGVEQFRKEFVDYYSVSPHGAFAFSVWTNNAWVAAQCLLTGISLVFPAYALLQNALNVGVSGGLLARQGELGTFFSYILPHGMLELTGIFVAAGAGLRLGWAWVDPGQRTRATALGVEGRAMAAVALGLVPLFAVAGSIEGFVTPSSLWPWVKLVIGGVVLAGFLTYVAVLGRRAERAGETGDLLAEEGAAVLPYAG